MDTVVISVWDWATALSTPAILIGVCVVIGLLASEVWNQIKQYGKKHNLYQDNRSKGEYGANGAVDNNGDRRNIL